METHILFFIIASVLIIILVGYSLWSARREKSRIDTFSVRPASAPLGTQTSTSTEPLKATQTSEEFITPISSEAENSEQWQRQAQEIQDQVQGIKIQLGNQTEISTEPEPLYHAEPQVDMQLTESEPNITVQEQQAEIENQFIILYVVAPQGSQFSGTEVVYQLEALGLQFGDHHIFHRHLDNANSPVLFSAANMMQPGVFDLTTIEQFSTAGLVFFMQLPSPNNDVANLRMMINTVEIFAQSLGGMILTDQEQLFDENARHAYFSRLRASH